MSASVMAGAEPLLMGAAAGAEVLSVNQRAGCEEGATGHVWLRKGANLQKPNAQTASASSHQQGYSQEGERGVDRVKQVQGGSGVVATLTLGRDSDGREGQEGNQDLEGSHGECEGNTAEERDTLSGGG